MWLFWLLACSLSQEEFVDGIVRARCECLFEREETNGQDISFGGDVDNCASEKNETYAYVYGTCEGYDAKAAQTCLDTLPDLSCEDTILFDPINEDSCLAACGM